MIKRKRSISTTGEIIELLINKRLPQPFTYRDVLKLLPHRSSGAVGGSLSTIARRGGVLKYWKTPGMRIGKYKLHPHADRATLNAVPTRSEILKKASVTRTVKKKIRVERTDAERVVECRAKLECILDALSNVESLLTKLEKELREVKPKREEKCR
jgi:hypothetical protein